MRKHAKTLTNAERQKRWRQRHQGISIKLTLDEAKWLAEHCRYPSLRNKIRGQIA